MPSAEEGGGAGLEGGIEWLKEKSATNVQSCIVNGWALQGLKTRLQRDSIVALIR